MALPQPSTTAYTMNVLPIKDILQSQSDPGSFTPRGEDFEEPMGKWQARALDIVLERHGMKGTLVEEDPQDVSDACCDAVEVDINNQYIGKVFQWLINNDYVLCRRAQA